MLGVTTWTLPVRGARAVRWARDAGFGTVHLDTEDVAGPDGVRLFREAAEELGMNLGALAVDKLGGLGYGDVSASRDAVTSAVAVAAELGVDVVYLPAFGAADVGSDGDRTSLCALLRLALDLSEPDGTVVALESPLHALELRRVFDDVAHPRLRLLFDTQNPSFWGHDAALVASELSDLIGPYVHVKDGTDGLGNARLGSGASGFGTVLEAVVRGGFRGTYVSENDYRFSTREDARQDQALLRHFLSQLDRAIP